MILDRQHFSFLVQLIDRGHPNATGSYAEGRVLDSLEFLNKGNRSKAPDKKPPRIIEEIIVKYALDANLFRLGFTHR